MNKLLLIITLLCCGCGKEDPNQDFRNYVNKESLIIAKQYNMQMLGSGGFNEQDIKGYTYMYALIDETDELGSRKLIVSFVEKLLNSVNSKADKQLTFQNFEIYIFFISPTNRYPNTVEKGLGEVRLIRGKVAFAISKKEDTFDLETIHVEPYAEAYEKITGQKYQPTANEAKSNE